MLRLSDSRLKNIGILTLVTVLTLQQFLLIMSFSKKDVQIIDATAEAADERGNDALGQCLDFKQDLDSLVANARQIFVTMPAKAGGTSIKEFTARCSKKWVSDNLLASGALGMRNYLVDSLHVQPIISSHLYNAANLIDLTKYPTRGTLMIHMHREETSRVVSGVKQISHHICNFMGAFANQTRTRRQFQVRKNSTHCILNEGAVVNDIAARRSEVGVATHDMLTCQSYKAIQENAPQLVFLHYKQVDKLQTLLAKHHCPVLLDELPVEENLARDKPLKVLLHKRTDNITNAVDLEEWLNAKVPALEWTLSLRRSASCQAKTIHMEDELFNCPEEALRVTPESIDRW